MVQPVRTKFTLEKMLLLMTEEGQPIYMYAVKADEELMMFSLAENNARRVFGAFTYAKTYGNIMFGNEVIIVDFTHPNGDEFRLTRKYYLDGECARYRIYVRKRWFKWWGWDEYHDFGVYPIDSEGKLSEKFQWMMRNLGERAGRQQTSEVIEVV